MRYPCANALAWLGGLTIILLAGILTSEARPVTEVINERTDVMRQMKRIDRSNLWQDKGVPSSAHEVQQISEKVKVIRFGRIREATENPWHRLAGMFMLGKAEHIEEMLHARGDEETAEDL